MVEKDFWVCWTLHQLFTIPAFKGHIEFKGGTSLSKVFGAIQRFSEDIDLIVDYEMLGFTGNRPPVRCPSRNKWTAMRKEMIQVYSEYIKRPVRQRTFESLHLYFGTAGLAVANTAEYR